jgi:hypothetical protein
MIFHPNPHPFRAPSIREPGGAALHGASPRSGGLSARHGRTAWTQAVMLALVLAGGHASGAQMSDAFGQRPREGGLAAIFTADTTAATLEPGELPGVHGSARNHTVWAQWTATASGWVTVDTGGSSFTGAMIAVYTGTGLNALTAVARGFDPDGTNPNPAQVRFPAAAGTSYQIMLDSTTDSTAGDGPGEVRVSLAPDSTMPASVPGHDSFPSRGSLSGANAYGVASTMKASVDAFEPISLGFRRQSIWWQWTAPQNGIVRLDTLQSDFDTVLVVYAGEAGGSDPFAGLDEVAASNNVLNSKGSSIAFRTEAGRVYQIMVDGYPDSTAGHGNAVVNLNQAISPNQVDVAIRGAVEVEIFARRGLLYQLQRSSNLIHWQNSGEPFAGSDQSVRFLESAPGGSPRYYRFLSR